MVLRVNYGAWNRSIQWQDEWEKKFKPDPVIEIYPWERVPREFKKMSWKML